MSHFLLIPLGVVSLALAVCWLRFCAHRPAVAAAVFIAVLAFSSDVFALAYRYGVVPATVDRQAVAIKDILAWSLFAVLANRATKERGTLHIASKVGIFLLIMLLFFIGVKSPAPFLTQLEEIRSVVIPILALAIGGLLTNEERRKCARLSVGIITIAAITGLVQLALPTSFSSNTLGIGLYWDYVKQVPLFVNSATGLPGNFFTQSGFPRLTGAFGDPLSAGEMIATGLVLAIAYRRTIWRPNLVIAILSISLLLTFTRDAWVLALLTVAVLSARRSSIATTIVGGALLLVIVVVASAIISPLHSYVTSIVNGENGSTLGHQLALTNSFSMHYSLFGGGWGTGGSFALNSYALAVASESAYVAVLAQVGWVGTSLLILVIVWTAARVVGHGPMTAIAVTILVAEVVSAFISENVLTFNGGFAPFFAAVLITAAPSNAKLPRGFFPSEATAGSLDIGTE